MKTLPLSELIVAEDRIRRIFDDTALMSLAKSIAEKGLLHPPCLHNDGRTLLAGERRVRAMAYLHMQERAFTCDGEIVPFGEIPYVIAKELSADDLLEAELEENVLREDLTWQERAKAVSDLHSLRERQHGAYNPSTREGWTARDTASEILGKAAAGEQTSKVVEATILARHLADPEVAKAKDQKEAIKIIKRKATAEHNAKLAQEYILDGYDHDIRCGDMREILPQLPSASFDVICTDPPYGIGADTFGDQASAAHKYEDSFEYFLGLIKVLARESYRVAKPQAHAYVFCDIRRWSVLEEAFDEAGWYVWPTPLIWDKNNSGMLPRPEHGPRRCYETILYAIKGNRPVTGIYSDVITVSSVAQPAFGAEKPQALYTNLLRRSVRPGDTVLDCFAGAGNILLSGTELNVTVTAIEMAQEKFNHIIATKVSTNPLTAGMSVDINSLFK